MKKEIIVFTLCICLGANLTAADNYASDVNLYNEISLAYKNQYYPGTVDKVDQLLKFYPDSVFLNSALACKGDALINMGRYEEAIETLKPVVSNIKSAMEENIRCNFLLGKAYYSNKDYSSALDYLYKACTLSLNENKKEYYAAGILYSGRSFFALDRYVDAVPLFEYIVGNGSSYNSSEYNESLQKLIISYNHSGNEAKTVALYSKLEKQNFPEDFYYTLCLYNADACKALNKNKEAYDYYCQVIENAAETLAVNALKKAYILATEKNIGVNPGEVFSKTVDTFKDNPELVNEFWIRLGIDEYENREYKKAEQYFANVENNSPVVTLYTAKILLDRDKSPEKAEKKLAELQTQLNEIKTENFSDSYYSVLLQCKFQKKKWNEVIEVFGKIKNPAYQDIYAVSSAYYENEQYKKVYPETGLLYASALAKIGEYASACNYLSKLELDSTGRIEYAKVLFACGRYEESYAQAQKSDDIQKDYISGLCQINLKNWTLAKNHFANYIKLLSGKQNFMNLVFFYKGYSEYCLEEYKNAYSSFVRFCSDSKNDSLEYIRNAYEYAAKAALQTGDFRNASIQAENVIKNSTNIADKQQAVLFCADIFTDYGEYEKALAILLPYTLEKSDFALQALFNSAKIYEKQGNVTAADNSYKKIYTDSPKSVLAEEAMYRCGEVYYSHKNYATALECFNKYIYKYSSGKFSDGAMFYCGDCSFRLGEIERSIMLNKTMIQKYPDSVYSYGANKNLMESYYEQESYSQALSVAKVMVKQFPEQSASDEIGRRLIELEKIVSGTDKKVAEKQSEYEKLGRNSTKKGRICGTELVKLYAESSDTQQTALDLAKEILHEQTANDEKLYAAENAEFIADYYRRNQQLKQSAEMYLSAAEYFRAAGKNEQSAAALYGAVEAFVAEGFSGDAEQTADLLIKLYPESKQAQRVQRLLD